MGRDSKSTNRFGGKGSLVAALLVGLGCQSPLPGVNLPSDTADSPIECPGGAPQPVRTWTVMHYAAADSSLQDSILQDINEMELGMNNGSPSVNVVVQLDRRDVDGVWRYEIQPDSVDSDPERKEIVSEVVGYSSEEPDSGDYRTLIEFGRWAATCYPADNYIIIVGGHGRGWSVVAGGKEVEFDPGRAKRANEEPGGALRFIAPDDESGSEIYIGQLATALEAIREVTRRPDDPAGLNRIVAYGSDACLMGTIEVAYDLRNSAQYLLGSEQKEPGRGWPYSTILRELNKRPSYYSAHVDELMAEFVDAYERSYGPNGAAGVTSTDYTLAAISTDGVGAANSGGMPLIRARNRVRAIAETLTALLDEDEVNRAAVMEQLQGARAANQVFGGTYTDLGHFLSELERRLVDSGLVPEHGAVWTGDERYRSLRNEIDELLTDVWPDLVGAVVSGADYPDLMGMSIYLPDQACSDKLPLATYAESPFARDTGWHQLVRQMLMQDIPEAEGAGTMDLSIDGQDFAGLAVDCRIEDNVVFVVAREDNPAVEIGGQPVSPPLLSMELHPSGGQLSIERAAIDARSFNGFRATNEETQPTTGAAYRSGEDYRAAAAIPFENWQERSYTVSVDFHCASFELVCD